MAANVLTSQWNNLKDWGKDLIQVPKIKKDDNIHDYGRVNMFGEFEYLNRIDGMGGLIGDVVSQFAGGATNFVRKEAAKLYLGNIRSWSVSNAIEMGKRLLNGDIAGGIQDIERLSGKDSELVRPIGGKRNIGEGLPDGGFTTSEIHDGGQIGRALNKGKVLDVDIINHTRGTENELGEVHFTTENIQENTSKTPAPRKTSKRQNDPEGNPIDEFVTSEIWPDPISRNLNKGTILDVDTINRTLGDEREIKKVIRTKKEIYNDPSQRNIEGTPTQVEIWKDPFQRNIDADTIGELPGYIKGRTKFLNEMNTHQSIRNNI